jgi:hypothetical protein
MSQGCPRRDWLPLRAEEADGNRTLPKVLYEQLYEIYLPTDTVPPEQFTEHESRYNLRVIITRDQVQTSTFANLPETHIDGVASNRCRCSTSTVTYKR